MCTRIFCACLLLLLPMSLIVLAEDSRWAKAIRTEEWAKINSVEQTFDGGFVTVGEKHNNDTDSALFIKLSSSGKLEWAKTYGSHAHAYMTLQASDGGFVFAGIVHRNALVVKLDSAGNILWQKTYGTSASYDEARSIIQTADGGFFVLGISRESGQSDVWCMKLRSDGTMLWQKRFGNNNSWDELRDAIGTKDGGLIFVGGTGNIETGYLADDLPWVVKLNQNGGILWQKVYVAENSNYTMASAITETADGGYAVGCTSKDGLLLKINADGVLSWQTAFHYEKIGRLMLVSGVRQEKDGHLLVMGIIGRITMIAGWTTGNIWTARLDSEGKMMWQNGFGKTTGSNFVSEIHDTRSDGTVFVGTMYTTSGADGLIAQTSSNGMTCGGFREPIQISTSEVSLTAKPAEVRTKKNSFVMQDAHLKQAPVSVKIMNLCSG